MLGLVGLCVGLTLSGCGRDCGGWGLWPSRKEVDPPQARMRKVPSGQTESDVSTFKPRTDPTNAVANKGMNAPEVRPAHDYAADRYDPPAGANENAEPAVHAGRKGVEPSDTQKILTEPDAIPSMTGQPPATGAVEKQPAAAAPGTDTAIPPEPPRQHGPMSSMSKREPMTETVKEPVARPAKEAAPAEAIPTTATPPSVEPPSVPPPAKKVEPLAPPSDSIPVPATKEESKKGPSEETITVPGPPPAQEFNPPPQGASGAEKDTAMPPMPPGPPSPAGK
jgi:hypothetical protein